MAPAKLVKEAASATQVNPTAEIVPARRVTRSQTRPSGSASAPPQPQPPKKKARKTKAGGENVKTSETKDVDADGSKKLDVGLSGSGSRTIIIERRYTLSYSLELGIPGFRGFVWMFNFYVFGLLLRVLNFLGL